ALAVPEQRIAVRAEGFRRRACGAHGGGIGLRSTCLIAAPATQAVCLALVVTQCAVPAVLREAVEQVQARARIVELDLLIEEQGLDGCHRRQPLVPPGVVMRSRGPL